ncbi:MAG: phytanoyl-CoA dioxygenase family protein [Candidatus Poribacteria bacterium]|nr:phytanoyl-CoA dioxygenase family protein [Candidatus Poribacteria bacterium]
MNRHKIHYEVLNSRKPDESGRHWEVEVHANPEELQAFAESGYLVRERLFQGDALQRLQDALDRLEEKEWEKRDQAVSGKRSWGFIPRHLMDKDEVFLELLKFQRVLSIARAMMGPLVRLRGLSARISYPGEDRRHQTPWHQHMRVVPNPLPPWFSRPHCIDGLIYLDDLNADTGPVAVVPGSHNWLDREPPLDRYEPIEGEVEVCVKAGGGVLIHGNLWHRALPTLNAKRRMLILSYTPTWLRKSPHGGPQPEDGLTKEFLEEADFETQMLLGVGGYS